MKQRFLNVSILQHNLHTETETCLAEIQHGVEKLMQGYIRPELIIGVEGGLGNVPLRLEGKELQFLSNLAKCNHIYFIPGTFAETTNELKEGQSYNTCPIFGPDGTLIRRYRKKVPFRPAEVSIPSNEPEDYCIFEIKEKQITVGLQICYDQFFPEIARTLALKGAEIILCPSMDPWEYRHIPEIIPRARALENELFYIWTCSSGQSDGNSYCGGSVIVNPEGNIIEKCPVTPALITKTLDFSEVTRKREYGRDQHLKSLQYFNVQYPFAGKLNEAEVFQHLNALPCSKTAYEILMKQIKIGNLYKGELQNGKRQIK